MNKIRKKVFISLMMSLVLFLSPVMTLAESKNDPKLDYLALGDSLAAGQTPNKQLDKGYADFLAGQLEKIGVLSSFDKRFAVPGYTTTNVLMDIESNIVKTDTYGNSITLQKAIQNAEIITLDVGAIDILKEININNTTGEVQFDQQQIHSTLNKFGENLINILTKIKTLNPNVDIYLMGFYYPFPYLSDNAQAQLLPLLNLLNKTIAEVGKPFQATFIPTAEAISQNPKAFLPNPLDIHPNKEGYLQLANAFWNKINVKKPTSFQDEIPDWALAEIQYLAQKGIINGYSNGSFGYDDHITRVHSGIMLDRSVIYNNESAPNPSYLDVAETTYGFDVISRLTKQGIFTGDNYYFYPDQSLTRAEMAKILVKAFQLTGTTPHPYSDVASDHWGAEYISILTENQITNGYPDGTFKPDHYITRAEFSKMLARVLNDRLVEKKK